MTYLKDKKLKSWNIIVVLILIMVFVDCKSKKETKLTPETAGSAKEIFEKAKKRMKKDPEKSRLLFKEIMHLYPDSLYAQRAKIGIADAYFNQKDMGSLLMAAAEYQEYANLFPNSPDAVYAKYQIGMCYYKQMKKPGRDQEYTHKTIDAFQAMVKMYPATEEARDAREKIAKARQYLAAHNFAIGLSNFRLNAFKGAIARFKEVMEDYPEFEKNDKLFFFTGRAYFVSREYDTAISFFQRLITDFPKSKYLKKSSKMIEKINQLKAQAPTPKKTQDNAQDNIQDKTKSAGDSAN